MFHCRADNCTCTHSNTWHQNQLLDYKNGSEERPTEINHTINVIPTWIANCFPPNTSQDEKLSQRWDVYLYLASNWSGLWLCIYSHLFKSQKLQITGCLCLSGPLPCVRFSSLFLSQIHSSLQGMVCDTECHCDKEVTPSLLTVSMYISLCFYSISPASPPLLPVLFLSCILLSLLHCCHCCVLWAAVSSLWLQTANVHSDSSRWKLIWTIC